MASIFGKFKKKKGQDGSAEKSKSPSQSQGQAPKGGSKGASSNASNSNVSSDGKVRGILRNKKDAEKYHNNDSYPTSDDLDESLRNARKNMAINLDVSKKDKNKTKANGNVIEDISEPSPSKGKEVVSDGSLQEAAKKVNQETDNMISSNNNNENNEMNNNNDNKDNNDSNNSKNGKNENEDNNENKNDNESKTDNDIDMTGQKKDVLWDEDNLRQNEEEKVPRMKIDEAPTPYHDMPDELMDGMDGLEHHSEEILDINPMDMATDDTESHSQQARSSSVNSNDANHKLNNNNSNEDPANTNKQLQMERQAALLQSSEYRDKMINDALQRRDDDIAKNTEKKKKVIQSAWEEDDPNSKNKNETASDDTSDNSMKKQDFKKKRAAHYNEFYAVKAMKEKMNQDNYDDDE